MQPTLGQFLADLAAPTPVPGGGSAAALAGALAAALVAMVLGLTVNRLRAQGQEVQAVLDTLSGLEALRARLLALVDEDAEAYGHVRAAYRLPRTTSAERELRSERIRSALRLAIAPPLATASACAELLPMAALAAQEGPRSATSDAYTAALLAHASFLASEQNVLANLHGLQDEDLRGRLEAQLADMKMAADKALAQAACRLEGKPGAPAR